MPRHYRGSSLGELSYTPSPSYGFNTPSRPQKPKTPSVLQSRFYRKSVDLTSSATPALKKSKKVMYQPVSLPFVVSDSSLANKRSTFDILQKRKSSVDEITNKEKPNVLTKHSTVEEVQNRPKKAPTSAKSKDGKMFVTDLWSNKYLKSVKLRSGVMPAEEKIQKAKRMNVDEKLKRFQDYFERRHRTLTEENSAVSSRSNTIETSLGRAVQSLADTSFNSKDSQENIHGDSTEMFSDIQEQLGQEESPCRLVI